jgi:hypothetical protein
MSTEGNVGSVIELRGRISMPDTIQGKSAYEVAVMNGFEGSEAEWLESLKGANGKDGHSLYLGDSTETSPEIMSIPVSQIKAIYGRNVQQNDTILYNNTLLRVTSKNNVDVAICHVIGSINGKDGHSIFFAPNKDDGATYDAAFLMQSLTGNRKVQVGDIIIVADGGVYVVEIVETRYCEGTLLFNIVQKVLNALPLWEGGAY